MVIYETVEIDGKTFEHVYSDRNLQVCRDGRAWDEVFNPLNTGRVYTEGDPIQEVETDGTAEEVLDVLLGGIDD